MNVRAPLTLEVPLDEVGLEACRALVTFKIENTKIDLGPSHGLLSEPLPGSRMPLNARTTATWAR
jgi:hypothetical protein